MAGTWAQVSPAAALTLRPEVGWEVRAMATEVKVREEAMKHRPSLLQFHFDLWRSEKPLEQELCVGHGLRALKAGLQGRSCPSFSLLRTRGHDSQ